jgi:hypothetical protein
MFRFSFTAFELYRRSVYAAACAERPAHQPRANGHGLETLRLRQIDLPTWQLFSIGYMRWLSFSPQLMTG